MNVQVSPNSWSCLATSFAIVLDMPVRDLFKELGHNGSEIIFELEEPFSRRSFHPQEFLSLALHHGYSIMMVEAQPVMSEGPRHNYVIGTDEENWNRLKVFMTMFNGVVTGQFEGRKPHAMAWDREKYYDPGSGKELSNPDFAIREFFALVPKAERSK